MRRARTWVPTGLGRYGFRYDGRLRLVDLRKDEVIAEGACTLRPVDDRGNPSADELRRDPARVKSAIEGLAQSCADYYRKTVLGLI